MKIVILPYPLSGENSQDTIYLTERDFNHYESFFYKHLEIQPESIEEIRVKCVLESIKYPLIIIRHIDWLLKVGGRFILDICSDIDWCGGDFRAVDIVGSMISISSDDRFVQVVNHNSDNIYHWEYIKSASSNPVGDSIDKWTFGICSNGSHNERVLKQIEQINAQGIPNCEIIVCGPRPSEELPKNVRIIDDTPIYKEQEVRYPIGKKKSLIVNNAKFNNLMIVHDRFFFAEDWYKRMKEFGNYFDIIMPMMYSEEDRSFKAAGDWKIAEIYNFGKIAEEPLIPYEEYDHRICVNGGIVAGKLDKIKRVPLLESYYWAEGEDVMWSAQITNRNYLLQVDIRNKIYTLTYSSGTQPNTKIKLYSLRKKRHYYERQIKLREKRSHFLGVPSNVKFSKDWWNYWKYKIACNIVKRFTKEFE